jgi:hypothetical protein
MLNEDNKTETDKQLLLRELEELAEHTVKLYHLSLGAQLYWEKEGWLRELTEATQEVRARRLALDFLEKSIKELK